MELSQVGPPLAPQAQATSAASPAPAQGRTEAAKSPPPPVATAQPSTEQVKQAVEEVQNAVQSVAQNLQFSVDKDTGQTIIKVMDASTNEVIRQIPAQEILTIAKAIDQMQQGLLLRQKA